MLNRTSWVVWNHLYGSDCFPIFINYQYDHDLIDTNIIPQKRFYKKAGSEMFSIYFIDNVSTLSTHIDNDTEEIGCVLLKQQQLVFPNRHQRKRLNGFQGEI